MPQEARLGQRCCRGYIVDPKEPTQPEVGLHGGASLSHGMVNHHDFPFWMVGQHGQTLGVADLLLDRSGMALDHSGRGVGFTDVVGEESLEISSCGGVGPGRCLLCQQD